MRTILLIFGYLSILKHKISLHDLNPFNFGSIQPYTT